MFSVVMPTFDDYDGVKFTAHDLLIHHGDFVSEVVVLDNNPNGRVGAAVKEYCGKNKRLRYVPHAEPVGTAPAKNAAIAAATSEFVVCVDSHVILFPNALEALARFYDQNPDKKDDMVHGPLVYDGLDVLDTQFSDVWGSFMWGRFSHDQGVKKAYDPRVDTQPFFEIWAMGTGCFAVRKESWLGFNPKFRGFGGEEVLIHNAYRKADRKVWCLSDFRWWHEGFSRPYPGRYPNNLTDRARNYILELSTYDDGGRELTRARDHFVAGGFSAEMWDRIAADPDAPCETCNQKPASRPVSAATPMTITSDMIVQRPQPANGVAAKPAAWGQRLAGLSPLPVAFGLTDAGAMWKWITTNAPKATRYLAVHGVAQFGEVWSPAGQPDKKVLGLMPAVRKYLKEHPEWSVVEYVKEDGGLLILSKSDEDRPKIKPGPAKKVLNFATSMAKHWWGGGHLLPLPMAEARLDHCLLCPSMAADRRCSECSCHLVKRPDGSAGKVFHPHDSCPLGKWLAVEVPKGGFKETGGTGETAAPNPPAEQNPAFTMASLDPPD